MIDIALHNRIGWNFTSIASLCAYIILITSYATLRSIQYNCNCICAPFDNENTFQSEIVYIIYNMSNAMVIFQLISFI